MSLRHECMACSRACGRCRTWLNANSVHIHPSAVQALNKALCEDRPVPLHIGLQLLQAKIRVELVVQRGAEVHASGK